MRTVIGKGGGEGITDKENSKQGHCVSSGCYGEDKKSCLRLRWEVRLKKHARARLPKTFEGDQGHWIL